MEAGKWESAYHTDSNILGIPKGISVYVGNVGTPSNRNYGNEFTVKIEYT